MEKILEIIFGFFKFSVVSMAVLVGFIILILGILSGILIG